MPKISVNHNISTIGLVLKQTNPMRPESTPLLRLNILVGVPLMFCVVWFFFWRKSYEQSAAFWARNSLPNTTSKVQLFGHRWHQWVGQLFNSTNNKHARKLANMADIRVAYYRGISRGSTFCQKNQNNFEFYESILYNNDKFNNSSLFRKD